MSSDNGPIILDNKNNKIGKVKVCSIFKTIDEQEVLVVGVKFL